MVGENNVLLLNATSYNKIIRDTNPRFKLLLFTTNINMLTWINIRQ